MPGPDRPTLEQLRAAKRAAQRRFGTRDGVEGLGIGDGCVRVYVRTRPVADGLPDEVDGVRLECVEVGTVSTLPADG